MNDKVSELNEEAISVKPKKQIVVREFKPKKEPINVIFCGHVDAGKSTIGGQIMYVFFYYKIRPKYSLLNQFYKK